MGRKKKKVKELDEWPDVLVDVLGKFRGVQNRLRGNSRKNKKMTASVIPRGGCSGAPFAQDANCMLGQRMGVRGHSQSDHDIHQQKPSTR